jgi:uncharacterized membrane protein (UPF0127 family)
MVDSGGLSRHSPDMRFAWRKLGWLAVIALLSGCGKPSGTGAERAGGSSNSPAGYLDHAQPPLATVKLWLGSQELEAEVARTAVEIQTGMMFRTNMAENAGMLFVFAQPFKVSFYMRNTTVPLSAAYLDPDGVIVDLVELRPLDETPVYSSSDRVQFVLEASQGWFARNGIGTGAVVRTQYGPLRAMNWAALRPARTARP